MNEEALKQRTGELIITLYGEGSPVSEEQIAGLIGRLQHERYYFAFALAKAVGLSGLSVEELTSELTVHYEGGPVNLIEPDSLMSGLELGAKRLRSLCHICEVFREKGYGDRLPAILSQPMLEDFLDREKKISVFEAIRDLQDPLQAIWGIKDAKQTT